MKITLFGATCKTGKYLINEALKRGFDVTVFANSAAPFEEPGLPMLASPQRLKE